MAFEYEVYAVDQLAGDLHNGLAGNHTLAVVQVAELHRLIFADGHPCSLNDIAPQNSVLAEGDVTNTFVFSA